MLNKIAIYPRTNKDEELYNFFAKYSPFPVELNPEIKSIKDTHVIISGYDKSYLDFDDSNEVTFLCRKSQLSNKEFLLLSSIDNIVTNSRHDGLMLSWQLQSKGYNKHIVPLMPWCTSSEITDGVYALDIDKDLKKVFVGYEFCEDPNAFIRVCLTESDKSWPYGIIEGMLSGAVPIVADRAPFNEFIIHGYNGFLVRSPDDIAKALRDIEEDDYWLTHNAKAYISALLSPTRYLEAFSDLKMIPGIRLTPAPSDFKKRTWLVRERMFRNGKLDYYPKDYNENLTLIDLNDAQEVLEYFLTQIFSEVYVFGCDIPDNLEKRDHYQLIKSIKKMGSRSLKIHFCRDEPIPKIWEPIFTHLSVISVEEGLKQILG